MSNRDRNSARPTAGCSISRGWLSIGWLSVCIALTSGSAAAEDSYGGRLWQYEGDRFVQYATGTNLMMEAIDPSLRKWYLPQEVAAERTYQWEYTNYARTRYRRYQDANLEGDYFYDQFGRFLSKGWVVYDWRQVQPASSEGSRVIKSSQYSAWFSKLVLSSDSKGQHHFSVMVGDEIRTQLTPMTFRKTAFNGVQFDYTNDHLAATVLMSRINLPVLGGGDGRPAFADSYTNLIGFRTVYNLGDAVKIGGTFVNSHHGRIANERFEGNPFNGNLTTGQLSERINQILVRITDDSPGDGGGPILFTSDIVITTRMGDRDTTLVGSEIGFSPIVSGGIERGGFRVAEGGGDDGQILLDYRLSDPEVQSLEDIIPDATLVDNIRRVRFRLLLSNDYKVEVASNVQTNNDPRVIVPQFVIMTRAEGNVKDNSNRKMVVFDYGLPTATQVAGVTIEANDLAGFRLYGEVNINHRWTKYPHRDPERDTFSTTSGIRGDRSAVGWMFTLSRQFYPFTFFGEAFGMDADYDTSPRFVTSDGHINYGDTEEARTRHTYDFVDDNDDNDRKNDQQRRFDDGRVGEEKPSGVVPFEGFADEAVFPGLDENNDFLPDFNQNNLRIRPNFLPDYEEPFLRYNVDRPEYLFALDLNNNGWGDRFENDNEPDYVYKRDRRGFNTYLGADLIPEARLTVGYERVRRPSTGEENNTAYTLFTYERNYPVIGVATFYNMFKLAEDDIADDLIQWVQQRPILGESQTSGGMVPIEDPLGMQKTLVNKAWLGFERLYKSGLNAETKVTYEIVHQREKGLLDRGGQPLKRTTRRFGLVNKAQYQLHYKRLTVTPRLKHELFMDDTPYHLDKYLVDPGAERHDWTGISGLLLRMPFMRRSEIQVGLERLLFQDFVQDEKAFAADRPDGLLAGATTGDYNETSLGLQLANVSPYLGYDLMLQMGLRIDWRDIEIFDGKDESNTSALTYVSIQAGLN